MNQATSADVGPALPLGSGDKPASLDDLMIAMDVVDTLRHREGLVARELNEAGREKELIERLKEIYRQQGIEVPDGVLAEGVKALKESRFTYIPPPPGLQRTLLTAWVKRRTWGTVAALALAVLASTCGYHYATVTRPVQQAEERVRIEVTETLPKAIRQAHADILEASSEPAVRQKAEQLSADGGRAIRDRDHAAMTRASRALAELRDDVVREYTLTIVSRPGETSGVWRVPATNPGQRNYYLVVEAIPAGGGKLRLPIRNEENGNTEVVDKFAVRVPKEVFDQVAADKRDDGIIQRNRLGVKKRGTLAIEYLLPHESGMITRW